MSHIATQILNQLGGNKFIAMTGCKNLMSNEDGLVMDLPKNQSKSKYLRIEITNQDTYNMIFRTKGKDYTFPIVEKIEGVYADMIKDIFTKVTGLCTSL